ncbi:MAG: CvpA family protein [Chloroflexi bacterium]|nr:CvpA family protein [Chloroflexota bacterium]
MNWMDIIIVLILAASVLGGLGRGTLRAIWALVAVVISALAAGLLYQPIGSLIFAIFGHPNASKVLGFCIAYGLVNAVVNVPVHWWSSRENWTMPGCAGCWDRLVAGAVGLVEGIATVELGLIVLIKYPIWILGRAALESVIGQRLLANLPFMFRLLPDTFRSVLELLK